MLRNSLIPLAVTVATVVAVGVAVTACAPREGGAGAAKRASGTDKPAATAQANLVGTGTVIARVGAEAITTGDIAAELPTLSPQQQKAAKTPEGLRELVETLIDRKLMSVEAQRLKLDEQPELRKRLAPKNLPLAEREQMLAEAFLARRAAETGNSATPDEAALRSYYKDHPEEFTIPAKARVTRMAFVDQGVAQQTSEQARDPTRFDQLVRDIQGTGASVGSVWLEQQAMAGPVAAAAFAMQPGEVSDPIPEGGRFVVIRVEESEPPSMRPFSDVRDGLALRLSVPDDELFRLTVREELRATAPVAIDDAALAKATEPPAAAAAEAAP